MYALITADGHRAFVPATGGGCTVTDHLTAEETSTQVALQLVAYVDDRPNIACPANLILWTRSVILSAPLGDRKLVDGTTEKPISYFDGKRLAKVRWLPRGARGPVNRPWALRRWARIYTFDAKRVAPIEIDQVAGNQLGQDELSGTGFVRHHVRVHGRRAVMDQQKQPGGPLIKDRLAWFEDGFTYIVESSPGFAWQKPFRPRTLRRIANSLIPSPTYIKADFHGVPARPCPTALSHQAISFSIEPDAPQPSCWRVAAFRSVTVVNATGDFGQQPQVITGDVRGIGRFRLEPGARIRLRLPSGTQFAVGDHCVTVSTYPDSCLAIWVAPGGSAPQ